MKNYYIGLDLGASSIKCGYGSTAEGIVFFHTIKNVVRHRTYLYDNLCKAVHTILSQIPEKAKFNAIGIGSPGVIDNKSGKIIGNCPNIKDWVGANPCKYLQEKFSVPVFIENDADLMTYGEAIVSGRENKSVLGITIGTGIGSGYVCGGSIYHSYLHSALEIGHTIVAPKGKYCLCGKRGCLEVYSSAQSILNEIKNKTGTELQTDDMLLKYNQDTIITSIIDDAYDKLGLSIANAVMILGAEVVVIGGGITESRYFDLKPLSNGIKKYLNDIFLDNILIMKAHLKNKAAVYGGIVLAEKLTKS